MACCGLAASELVKEARDFVLGRAAPGILEGAEAVDGVGAIRLSLDTHTGCGTPWAPPVVSEGYRPVGKRPGCAVGGVDNLLLAEHPSPIAAHARKPQSGSPLADGGLHEGRHTVTRVLLLTLLPFHSSGNQVLKNFVLGLCGQGAEVLVLTARAATPTERLPFLQSTRLRVVYASSPVRTLRRALNFLTTSRCGKGRPAPARRTRKPLGVWDTVPIIAPGGPIDLLWWAYLQGLFLLYGLWYTLRFRPKILIGYEVHAAVPAVILSRLFRKKVVTRFQGSGLYYWLRQGRLPVGVYPFLLATRAKSDLVIMANDGTRGDRVCKMLGHPPEKVWFAPEGVRVGDQASPGQGRRRDYIIWVGRMKQWKRLDRALLFFRWLDEALQGTMDLVVVGDGPWASEWKGMAESLPCRDRVQFVGGLDHSSLLRVMEKSTALLSMYDGTNLSMAVQEALVRKIPVITVRDGSTDGLLSEENSIMIEWGADLATEALRVSFLLRDMELLGDLAHKAYRSYARFGLSEERRRREEAERILGIAAC